MKRSKSLKILIIAVVLLLLCGFLYARAGGGGGGSRSSSSGGSGSSDGGAIIYLFILLARTIGPIPTIIVFAVGFLILSRFGKNMKQQSPMKNLTIPSGPADSIRGYKTFLKNNPDFVEKAFREKAATAFLLIQEAWSSMDIKKVRRFISDGVYQRFNTQFKMMKLLKQSNPVDHIRIDSIQLVKFDTDGRFDNIDIAITATMRDKFICESNHSLDSPGGTEQFTEFWSFLKKRGAHGKDIYSSDLCPNCAAPLQEDLGEIGKCGYCGVLVNSGEFDWILSEITQADDYYRGTALRKTQNLAGKITTLISEYEDFSVQLLEDKASNGYLQVKTALVMKDLSLIRRFVTGEAFSKIESAIPKEQIVFNRLYLNDVSLIGAQRDDRLETNRLIFSITLSYQRVVLQNNGKAKIIDPAIVSQSEVMVMERAFFQEKSKGSLYTHTCPSCGGSIGDSVDLDCSFCGLPLNSSRNEWIISDIMSIEQYRNFYSQQSKQLDTKTSPAVLDNLFEVKDYALNNVMVMIGADGVFAEEERIFAEEMARKWGFNVGKIKPLFDLAKTGRLSIKMPADQAKRKVIYQFMEKAARADHTISMEEKAVLSFVSETYLKG